ncbi:substrate-binding domain-containing protein [Actinomadura miaoliensis]|uniref:Periplasmic binding protein domain-containing protein n=1 Tax=Actinomadura miaoliensis TaxID=430685 RepID=A0ABP7VSE3_9ACTN
MHFTRRFLAVTAAGALTLGAATACSTERESPGTGLGAAADCDGPQAQALRRQYADTWRKAGEAIGLQGLSPGRSQVCEIDTARFAKKRPGGGYRIAFAAQGPTNAWALTNEEAFKYRARQRGAKVLYASANGDVNRQVDNVQQLVAQRPDALVVVPMGDAITGQVRAAAGQGIPVVVCAGRLGEGSGAVSTVTRDYELQGTLWAEWIARRIGGQGKIAMLSGIAGVPTAELPKAQAEKIFATKYPGIQVVAKQNTDWSATKSKTVAAQLLARHPDLKAIWSDSAITDLGVYEAYSQAGRPVPPVTGDVTNAFLKAVRGENVPFALSAFPPEQSMRCLDVALDALAGRPVPSQVNVDSAVFTDRRIDQYARPECSDDLAVPSALPADLLKRLKLC